LQVQNGKLTQTLLHECYLVKQVKYWNAREVSETYQLEPGTYVLVPSTYYPNEQAEFLLRAYFQKGNCHKDTSSNSNLHHPMPAPNRTDNSSWEQIFNKYAQSHQPNWSLPRFNGSDSFSPHLSPSPFSPTTLERFTVSACREIQTVDHYRWAKIVSCDEAVWPGGCAGEVGAVGANHIQNCFFKIEMPFHSVPTNTSVPRHQKDMGP
ncbi:uncharacterized protein LOC125482236, partial [Rhincodon typus]|uniref:uncharacterized protein LOC125482236 n=1 Tax=Rhincodon typus TaxID=259920 RepID=UPI00202F37F2